MICVRLVIAEAKTHKLKAKMFNNKLEKPYTKAKIIKH